MWISRFKRFPDRRAERYVAASCVCGVCCDMQNRHLQNLERLNAHLKDAGPVKPPLSAAEYAEQVARYLARAHPTPAQGRAQRSAN